MEDEILNKVKHVLNDWNPPGENASKIQRLKKMTSYSTSILR